MPNDDDGLECRDSIISFNPSGVSAARRSQELLIQVDLLLTRQIRELLAESLALSFIARKCRRLSDYGSCATIEK